LDLETASPRVGEDVLDHLLVDSLTHYAIFAVDPAGLIVRWNAGAEKLFGYSASEVIGRHFGILFTPEDVAAGAPGAELAESSVDGGLEYDRWHVRKDGTRFWGMNRPQPLYDEHKKLLGFTKIVHDLSEQHAVSEAITESEQSLRALFEKTQYAALHDDLTGLANRALFKEYLERAVARSERFPEQKIAVLFFDLDNFKATNDTFGHSAGDQLLVLVTRRLERLLRKTDVLARFGGDEFAILLQDMDDPGGANLVAGRIVERFLSPFTIDGNEIFVGASIGISVPSPSTSGPSSVHGMLGDADIAMYEAKSQGGSRFVVFDDLMRTRAGVVMQLDRDLREALARGELRVVYQPIVGILTRRIVGFEALVRWQRAERSGLSPGEIRAQAEKSGAILRIDRWVLEEAAAHLSAWRSEFPGLDGLKMSVNFSAGEFERPGLARELQRTLGVTALPAQSIAIVITDTLTSENADRVVAALEEIRAAGGDIHLGDFGTGSSSFVYLSRLPITTLRFDASSTTSLENEDRGTAVIRAMVAVASSLGLKSVASGITTEAQLEDIANFGCTEAQGSLFSGPVDADGARELLARSSGLVNVSSGRAARARRA
jgi:diguanylate cyclase (GGDEF)-like protein/PAS domain S-box-containing protein